MQYMDWILHNQVKFDNIEELQARNAQLLQIVRKLSEEQEKWASSSSMAIVQTSTGTPTRRGGQIYCISVLTVFFLKLSFIG